jgi:hypothetical protein
VGETPEAGLYIAMELVEGKPLSSLAESGTFTLDDALAIAIQVGDALDAAHRCGVVHRDIKPANILMSARGLVKVLDFGIAKQLREDPLASDDPEMTRAETRSGQVIGTPGFMSPEQALGQAIDHRTDLFSLGVVLYKLMSGCSPFAGASLGDTIQRIVNHQPPPLSELVANVPPEFDSILERCLAKRPDDRFSTAAELVQALRELLQTLEQAGKVRRGRAGSEAWMQVLGENAAAAGVAGPGGAAGTDVFISFSQIDDQPLMGSRVGWVSQFSKNLSVRLEQLSGERVRILPAGNPVGPVGPDERLLERIGMAKAMVTVVSPPFAKSAACQRQTECFYRAAQQSGVWRIENRARLFKVVKTPVDQRELPPSLTGLFNELLDYEFFEIDNQTGRLRELSEEFGEKARRQFLERIYDLAHEVNTVVLSMKEWEAEGRPKLAIPDCPKAVYLAETTSDLRAERDAIRRELLERGFQVLPESPLPFIAEEAEGAIRKLLLRSDAVIHLIGPKYGFIPEGAATSLVEIQTRLSGELCSARGFHRFIWTPKGLQVEDLRQSNFLQALRRDPTGMDKTELLAGPIEQVKTLVIRQLTAPPKPAEPAPSVSAVIASVRQVYLLHEAVDALAVEPIEDYLFDLGFEVKTPSFEGDPATCMEMHHANLCQCDAVLIYFGNCSVQWIEMKMMELLKAPGLGRQKSWLSQVIYVAPPVNRRKERFRSHQIRIVHEMQGFDAALLAEFVGPLAQKGGTQ